MTDYSTKKLGKRTTECIMELHFIGGKSLAFLELFLMEAPSKKKCLPPSTDIKNNNMTEKQEIVCFY